MLFFRLSYSVLFASFAGLSALFLNGHNFLYSGKPAYAQRGDEVERRFRDYSERLADHRKRLMQVVASAAPELLVHFGPSEKIQQGYQVLPSIVEQETAQHSGQHGAVAYSWPWTMRLIDRELQALAQSQSELRRFASLPLESRRILLEGLVSEYRVRSVQSRNIAAHIAYNRFWQAAIAANRAAYDRETALQRLVIERQRIDHRLEIARGVVVANAVRRTGAPMRIAELEQDLLARRTLLATRIDHATRELRSPTFVRMERSADGWIFHVPLLTDITDRNFVEQIRRIIETKWRIHDAKSDYRVVLDITYMPAELLYSSRQPKPGDPLDLQRHLARFPPRGAILTTGGLTTHVTDYAIVLGPHPLTANFIAHEFGHVLGFRDRYIRGYRNLGTDGFQVMEIVADPDDIMAATNQGAVQSTHFRRLFAHYAKKAPELKPTNQLERRPALTKS